MSNLLESRASYIKLQATSTSVVIVHMRYDHRMQGIDLNFQGKNVFLSITAWKFHIRFAISPLCN